MSKIGLYVKAKMKLDIRYYTFFSSKGYVFSCLTSKLASFERFMAIDKVFEKIFVSVRKSKKSVDFGHFLADWCLQ